MKPYPFAYHRPTNLAEALYNVFLESKNIAEQDLLETRALKIGLPWLLEHVTETKKIMGKDIWSYGIKDNYAPLQTSLNYVRDQGLADHQMQVEDLFV